MIRPNIYAIHAALRLQGIPVEGVEYKRDTGAVVVDYLSSASDQQREAGDKLVSEWDQESADALRDAGKAVLPTVEDINAATKLADLKQLALSLRAYIDLNG